MLITVLSISLPTLMVFLGIMLNRNDANRLDARITSLESGLRSELSGIRSELSSIRAQFHGDILMLMGRDTDKDTRITRLESSSS